MSFTRSLALVSACACATAASAIVNVVPTFDPVGPGLTENPNVDGMAIVNFNDATFESSVTMLAVGLVRNTNYGVNVDALGAQSFFPVAFTARTFLGIGLFNTVILGDATQNLKIQIYRWDGDPDPSALEVVTPDEQRAEGFGSNIL